MSATTLKKILFDHDEIDVKEYDMYFDRIASGKAQKLEVVALLAGLSSKTLSTQDIVRFVSYLDKRYKKQNLKVKGKIVNIVGTGGGISTFNISTTAAFVAASAGATVLKSGSFSFTSKSGSMDLLKALGVPMLKDNEEISKCLEECNISFVSPEAYPIFLRRLAISILPLEMKDIGGFINTVGPLLCPFNVYGQVTGVSDNRLLNILEQAFQKLGRNNSLLVRAAIGIDEFSSIGFNDYRYVLDSNNVERVILDASTLGFKKYPLTELEGDDSQKNAETAINIFKNIETGVKRDIVLVNSASILMVAGIAKSIKHGIDISDEAIISGKSMNCYERLSGYCNH